MRLVLIVLLGLTVLLVLGSLYALRRLKRLAKSSLTHELMESFDGGLVIPMRDCDTRRPARSHNHVARTERKDQRPSKETSWQR